MLLEDEFALDMLFPADAAEQAELEAEARRAAAQRADEAAGASPQHKAFAISGFRSAARRSAALAHKEKHRSVEEARERLLRCRRELDTAKERRRYAARVLQDMATDAASKAAELARLRDDGAASGRLAAAVARADAARAAHRKFAAGEHAEATRHETEAHEELRDAELDAAAAASLEGELVERDARDARDAAALATAVRTAEERAVAAHEHARDEARAAAAAQTARREEADRAAVAAAAKARTVAARRLAASRTVERTNRAEFEAQRASRARRRAEALLDLKDSTEAAAERVRASGAVAAQRRAAERAAHERDAAALLAAGHNPYEVQRRRELAREAKERERRLAREQSRRMAGVREAVARDEAMYQREHERERVEEEHLARHRASLGPHVKDAETARYMRTNTRTGETLLEPDGKAKPFPSQVMDARTWDFGMGRADDEITDKIKVRHPGVGPNELLLSSSLGGGGFLRRERELNEDREAVRKLDSPDSDGGQGRGSGAADAVNRAAVVADEEEEEPAVFAEPEFEGRWGRTSDKPTSKAAAVGGDGSETHRSHSLYVAPRSKLEERYLAEARARAKEGMVRPQVVLGKTHVGPAFLAKPDIILFSDFEVGKVYTQRVTLTNVSRGYNTFRLLEIEDAVKDFFVVDYTFPGKLSAGMSCELTVTFEPKVNEDIDSVLPLLAETGRVDVPLVAKTRKCDVSASQETIRFGGVMLGERKVHSVTLFNVGAIDAPFSVTEATAADGKNATCLRFTESGVVPAYGETTIPVTYAPTAEAPLDTRLCVSFDVPERHAKPPPSIEVGVTGSGAPVALSVDTRLIDFKTCVHGRVYRAQVKVFNRSKSALKCKVVSHPALAGFIEFRPRLAFCQAGSEFVFNLKMSPSPEMLHACRKLLVDGEDTPIIEAPMRIVVPDQVLPVDFTVRVRLTTSDLSFDPPRLDLGRVAVGERTAAPLRITNHSSLPQHFGFVGLERGARVEGGGEGAFGMLLPGETVERTVSYAPPYAGDAKFSLPCRTLSGRTFRIPLTATCVAPPLSFSHNIVRMQAAPRGDIASASVYISNTSQRAQTFELVAPQGSDIKVSPCVATVAPGCRQRIQVDHMPRRTAALPGKGGDGVDEAGEAEAAMKSPQSETDGEGRDSEAAGGLPDGGADGGAEGEDNGEVGGEAATQGAASHGGDADPRSPLSSAAPISPGAAMVLSPDSVANASTEHAPGEMALEPLPPCHRRRWTLPLYIKPQEDEGVASALNVPLHLEVHTCTVEAEVAVEGAERVPGRGYYRVDFGQIPVGNSALRTLMLTNLTPLQADLSASASDPHGPFLQINAFRPLGPSGGAHPAVFSFAPSGTAKYSEVCTLTVARSHIRLQLIGEGISPTMRLEGPDESGALDLGDTPVGGASQREVTLVNTSPFALEFSLCTAGAGRRNRGSLPAFHASPSAGVIAPNESVVATVTFQPDHEYEFFEDTLEVTVPNQERPLAVDLRGACWERGMYVAGGDRPAKGAHDRVLPLSNSDHPARSTEVVLTFPEPLLPGETAEGCLFVGCAPPASAKTGGSAAAPGELALDTLPQAMATAGWSVTAAASKVSPGERVEVKFAFAPPANGSMGLAALGLDEWCEARVRCVLSGGAPAVPEGQGAVTLVARALLKAKTSGDDAAKAAEAEAKLAD